MGIIFQSLLVFVDPTFHSSLVSLDRTFVSSTCTIDLWSIYPTFHLNINDPGKILNVVQLVRNHNPNLKCLPNCLVQGLLAPKPNNDVL